MTVSAGGDGARPEERLLAREAVTEAVVERSRFIGLTFRLEEPDPASALSRARQRHPDATHHAWAYRWTPGEERADDAGEPQGTAGLPLLDVLRRHQLVRTVVVVVRYFGGVKLGRAGLYRAYRDAAEAAVRASDPTPVETLMLVSVDLAYPAYEPFRRWLESVPHRDAAELAFAERVTWSGWIREDDRPGLASLQERWYGAVEVAVRETRQDVL